MASIRWITIGLLASMGTRYVQGSAGQDCSFTIMASEGIGCPAGQLPDGQIRLNGSYPTASFKLNDGKIWDFDGKGCIVTEAPTTQFQCDENKEPTAGFSIDSSNVLAYKGSSTFYACPATDTEYNVYVQPEFGQAKCFEVKLEASDCGAAPTAHPAPSNLTCAAPEGPATVTETCIITNTATSTTTIRDTTTETTTSTVTSSTTVNIPTTTTETCIVTKTSTTTISIPGKVSMRTETETCTVTESATLTWPITITNELPCYSATSSRFNTTKPTSGCHKCAMNGTTLKTTTSNSLSTHMPITTASLSQY